MDEVSINDQLKFIKGEVEKSDNYYYIAITNLYIVPAIYDLFKNNIAEQEIYDDTTLLYYGIYYSIKKDYQSAYKYIKASHGFGNAYACALIGSCYETGIILKKDIAEALKYYQQSADLGNPAGLYGLAGYYIKSGTKFFKSSENKQKDNNMAIQLYKQSSDLGFRKASEELVKIYYRGAITEKNVSESFRFVQRADEQGSIMATQTLAYYYYSGICVEKNLEQAIKYYHKAADFGDIYSMVELGRIYCYESVEKNYVEGIKWLKLSADKNNEHAKYMLDELFSAKQKDLVPLILDLDKRNKELENIVNNQNIFLQNNFNL
jgi:TPR repeat protein